MLRIRVADFADYSDNIVFNAGGGQANVVVVDTSVLASAPRPGSQLVLSPNSVRHEVNHVVQQNLFPGVQFSASGGFSDVSLLGSNFADNIRVVGTRGEATTTAVRSRSRSTRSWISPRRRTMACSASATSTSWRSTTRSSTTRGRRSAFVATRPPGRPRTPSVAALR